VGKSDRRTRDLSRSSEWTALGIHTAFLRWVEIYKVGIEELHRIEKRHLPLDRLNPAKKELQTRISKRLHAELGLIMPESVPNLAGMNEFYGTSFIALKDCQEKSKDPHSANGIGLMEFDAQQRFHRPLYNIFCAHWEGDAESTSNYLKLEFNRERVRYGFGLPPFKGNIDHRILMQTGLGLGLEGLSATELENFYRDFCPCESEDHDADDLRKLRKRILEEGRQARMSRAPKFCGTKQHAT
jgi:hypothetical protein